MRERKKKEEGVLGRGWMLFVALTLSLSFSLTFTHGARPSSEMRDATAQSVAGWGQVAASGLAPKLFMLL